MIIDPLDTIAANSFRNFHAKGLDYLCLHRSPELTIKAYFYELGQDSAPEVVCPHDHRYPFSTHVLAGRSGHIRYRDEAVGEPTHERFDWRTPLNGGAGFEWSAEARLDVRSHEQFAQGQSYWCDHDEIHTITINRSDTVLLLYQHADTLPIDLATSTYAPLGSPAPSTAGLYDRMTLADAEKRLRMIIDTLNPRYRSATA